jgi:hypothetical protein
MPQIGACSTWNNYGTCGTLAGMFHGEHVYFLEIKVYKIPLLPLFHGFIS